MMLNRSRSRGNAHWPCVASNLTFAGSTIWHPSGMSVPKKDIEPEIEIEEDEEPSLPQAEETEAAAIGERTDDSLAAGRDAILRYAKLAPSQPGVYRMI